MKPVYTEETATCKKCGEQHRVDEYRGVKHYVCPVIGRVMLLVQDNEETDTKDPRAPE